MRESWRELREEVPSRGHRFPVEGTACTKALRLDRAYWKNNEDACVPGAE